ncbi:MAG: SRPBCC family protein [Flavobacteriales bacterium]|jgi:ligand-binding SRPBCC domain-containing protein|nr:SRPBCC family protein [Flavobacteriales bacterium]
MPTIRLRTEVKAGKALVFDLSRSIDLHKLSTAHTHETAIAGKTSGLIGLNEWVTWRAKHFGIYQQLTSEITAYERPNFFVDEMVSGAFKSFRHEHHFEDLNGESDIHRTLMLDTFTYRTPLGLLGRLADALFLERYMTELLEKRNAVVKDYAESEQWKAVLPVVPETEVTGSK